MSRHHFDLTKFKQCATHGHYAGAFCPLCEDVKPDIGLKVATSEPENADPFASQRESWWKGLETELHDLLETWLGHHGIEAVHARTDQKSTIENGWPDFSCFLVHDGVPRCCFVELKNRTGKLRKDQVEVIDRLRARGLPVLVSGNFQEVCDFITHHLHAPCSP